MANGNRLVVVDSDGAGTSPGNAIEFVIIAPDGTEVASGTSTSADPGTVEEPNSAALSGGGFVLVYRSFQNTSANFDDSDINIHIFDANGVEVTPVFDVMSGLDFGGNNGDRNRDPDVVALSDGGFIVFWERNNTDQTGMLGRRYDASGTALGDAFTVAVGAGSNFGDPAATLLDNGLVAVSFTNNSFVETALIATEELDIVLTDTDETITATSGDDIIEGAGGAYSLDGGDGIDTLELRDFGAIVDLELGTLDFQDSIDAGVILNFENVIGSNSFDTIAGDGGDNSIKGNAGAESFEGRAGGDTIRGNVGQDSIRGGNGNNMLFGGAAHYFIEGGNNVDFIEGGDGIDTIFGNDGADIIFTNTAADTEGAVFVPMQPLDIEDSAEFTLGGAGKDQKTGSANADVIDAGLGDDLVFGGGGNDLLIGANGDDQVSGGAGNDAIFGDYFSLAVLELANSDALSDLGSGALDFVNSVVELASGGEFFVHLDNDDSTEAGEGDDLIGGGNGEDTVLGEDTIYGDEGKDSLVGGEGADTMDGADELEGGDGADELRGQTDNDTLVGNDGNDTLNGGRGNDLLFGGVGDDRLFAGTAHRPRKPSSRWNPGRSCTNIQTGPFRWG